MLSCDKGLGDLVVSDAGEKLAALTGACHGWTLPARKNHGS